MNLKLSAFIYLLSICFYCALIKPLKAQEAIEIRYNRVNDTLLIINGKLIDTYKVIMERQELKAGDTIKVNQKDLLVSGFKMSAIALGNDIVLSNKSNIISDQMINEIINGETKYKFIYLKDIILQSKDGRLMSPSTKSIKIIFSN